MDQHNSGPNESPTSLYGHDKRTHEANPEEHKFYQYSGYTRNRRGTNRNIGVKLQPLLHRDHQPPTTDIN